MDRTELERLARKYLNGKATTSEKELLNQWYDTIHTGQIEFVQVETPETESELKQRMFDNILAKLNIDEPHVIIPVRTLRVKRLVLRIASAAAIVFVATGLGWYYTRIKTPIELITSQLVDITTKKITKIILPDGSTVWLNARTEFKYPQNFTGKLRQVELVEGRAFFDVKHESLHPFIVKTKSLNIIVLGTSFDVRTYPKDGTTRVNVISGKVGITRPGHANEAAVMLLPKQEVVLNKASNVLTKDITPEPVVNLWCKSPLVFDQENLDNVFKAIEKKYNTHIEVEDQQLLNQRISITLSNQRLDTIMEILSFTKHFKYQMANDSTVVIK